jgi:hypothetical protein
MNRRSFLSMMGFVAPAAIVKPTYFFAPPGGWGVKLYSTIGAWADYPPFTGSVHPFVVRDLLEDPRTATGIDLLFGTSTLKMPWTVNL